MNSAIDKNLYQKVKEDAKKKFKRFPSAYASMWIQKEYQRRGGEYNTPKKINNNLGRWREEKWIQVLPYLNENKEVICGSSNKNTKVCRPLIRIDKDTPPTLPELIQKHGKENIRKLAIMKNNDMKGRVMWKFMKFIKSQ
jgi:hypothetical protein